MNKHYIRPEDWEEPTNEELGIRPWFSFGELVSALFLFVGLPLAFVVGILWAGGAFAEARVGELNKNAEGFRSSTTLWKDCKAVDWTTLMQCVERAKNQARADGVTKVSGRNWYGVKLAFPVDFFKPVPTCAAPPAPRLQTCPSGWSGAGWQQQPQQSAYPACAITWQPIDPPAGSCTQIPANSALLTWEQPMQNTDGSALTNLKGFTIHYGKAAAELTSPIGLFIPTARAYRVENLEPGTWYFGLRAVNTTDAESPLSKITSKVIR